MKPRSGLTDVHPSHEINDEGVAFLPFLLQASVERMELHSQEFDDAVPVHMKSLFHYFANIRNTQGLFPMDM